MKNRFVDISIIIVVSICLAAISSRAQAAELTAQSNILYEIDNTGSAKVTISETMKNIAQSTMITARIYELPTTTSSTIRVYGPGGNEITTQISQNGEYAVVRVPFSQPLATGQQTSLRLVFDQPRIARQYGRIWEIWAPGLYHREGSQSVLTISVPKRFGPTLFVDPSPTKSSETVDRWLFEFQESSALNKTIWIELGDKQVMLVHGDLPLPGNQRIGDYIRVVLPRDIDNGSQQVVIAKMQPEPLRVDCDEEGNYFAVYEPGNLSASQITYDAFVILRPPKPDPAISYFGKVPLEQQLQPQTYWEANDPEIIAEANKVALGLSKDEDIGRKLYEYVISNLTYDDAKLRNNERLGAAETLRRKSGVCMEYSDLLIALCRAKGIPARSAFGYAYDPNNMKSLDNGHQWCQIYLNERGWIDVDPTWGEIGRDYYGQPSLSHNAMYITGTRPQLFSYLYYGHMPIDEGSKITSVPVADEYKVIPQMVIALLISSSMPENSVETLTIKIINTGNVALHDVALKPEVSGLTMKESLNVIENIPPYGEAIIETVVKAQAAGSGHILLNAEGRELGGQIAQSNQAVGIRIYKRPAKRAEPKRQTTNTTAGLAAGIVLLLASRAIWQRTNR